MALLSISCAVAMYLGGPCPAVEQPAGEPTPLYIASAAVTDRELAAVRGTGLPQVGLDQADEADRARSVDIAFYAERTSDQTRNLVDNWNVQVGASLIAQTMADARR